MRKSITDTYLNKKIEKKGSELINSNGSINNIKEVRSRVNIKKSNRLYNNIYECDNEKKISFILKEKNSNVIEGKRD